MRQATTVGIGLALLATVLHAQGIDISRHGSRPPIRRVRDIHGTRIGPAALRCDRALEGDRRPGHVLGGARTAWHTHPAGQTLIVTAGTGWVQAWNGEQEIRPGDVVWTPPGVKHWHGATRRVP